MLPANQIYVQWQRGASAPDGERGTARISLPVSISDHLGADVIFQIEMVEEGILLRYVSGKILPQVERPDWMRRGEEQTS